MPCDKFSQVVRQVTKAETLTQCKTVGFTTKFHSDDAIVPSQFQGQRFNQRDAASQTWDQDNRRTAAPVDKARIVGSEIRDARYAGANARASAHPKPTI